MFKSEIEREESPLINSVLLLDCLCYGAYCVVSKLPIISDVQNYRLIKIAILFQDAVKSAPSCKEPKDDNRVQNVLNGGSTVTDSDKMNAPIDCHTSQPDMTDITIPPSASSFLIAKKVEVNLKIEATDDQSLENSDFPPRHFSVAKQCVMDDSPQNQLKAKDCSSIIPDESKTMISMQNEEQKPQVLQKDSDHQECLNTSGSEPVLHERWKCPVESKHVSKTYSTASMKSNGADPSPSALLVQKVVGIGKGLPNSTALVGSKSTVCSDQNSTANAISSSLSGKSSSHMVKQQRVKVTNPSAGTRDTSMASASAEDSKTEGLQQPAQVHPTGAEFMGSKSFQAGKTSAPKNRSSDSKEQPSVSSCQASAENHETSSSATVEATTLVQSPSSQHKATASVSSQKIDKIIQPSSQPASKFLSHSLVMQSSTSTNAATTLSDEEVRRLWLYLRFSDYN